MSLVYPGLESFCQSPGMQGPIGLLTNVASLTSGRPTALWALRNAGVYVSTLFAPEHGYFGLGSAGEAIADAYMIDDHTNRIPIYSLYGMSHAPAVEILRPLKALLIDLQDVGVRWYTFLATIRHMLAACAEARVP